jgi:hypothetical protein
LTVAFAVVAAVAIRRGPDPGVRRLAALSGAIIALLQLSANYWNFTYLAWLLPFILVALFPPLLQRSQQPEPRVP